MSDETVTQKTLPLKTNTYVRVKGQDISLGQTLPAWGYSETDPHDLIQRWRKDGGIYLDSKFVPWKFIDSVTWDYNRGN